MPLSESTDESILTLFLNSDVRLYTVAPTDEDPGFEVSGSGYAPQPSTLTQDLTDSNIARNSDAIVFDGMPECDVVAIGLTDAGGSLLWYDVLSSPKPFTEGEVATLPAEAFVVTVS